MERGKVKMSMAVMEKSQSSYVQDGIARSPLRNQVDFAQCFALDSVYAGAVKSAVHNPRTTTLVINFDPTKLESKVADGVCGVSITGVTDDMLSELIEIFDLCPDPYRSSSYGVNVYAPKHRQ